MRKGRIFQWVLAVIIAGLLFKAGQYVDYMATQPAKPEMQTITVYAPDDMENAFNEALIAAELDETYKIVMTDTDDANICVGYGKQNDKNYQKIAFSPFVVAYNASSDNEKALKKSEVFVESPYADDYLEVDFLKIINEAIGEGKWANFNTKNKNELKVFYPSENSKYWHDFYDFLLVTVNDGKYPKTETEMQNAKEVIEKFLDSECTEGIVDFYEQVERTGGFPASVIYILPEKDALDICSNKKVNASIYYPVKTVYFNYYIKSDEMGKQIIDILDEFKKGFFSNYSFYYSLANERYRSVKYSELKSSTDYAYYERDVYNVVKIPETVEFATTDTNPTTPTSE